MKEKFIGTITSREDLKVEKEPNFKGWFLKEIKSITITDPYPTYPWHKKVRKKRFWFNLLPRAIKGRWWRWKYRNSIMEDC